MPLKRISDAQQGEVKYGENDGSFYFKNMGPDAFVGYIDDNEDMSEEAVSDYISRERPDLFERLQGLPISSRDIPMSFEAQKRLDRLQRILPAQKLVIPPNTMFQSRKLLRTPASLIPDLAHRHREYIQSKVLGQSSRFLPFQLTDNSQPDTFGPPILHCRLFLLSLTACLQLVHVTSKREGR